MWVYHVRCSEPSADDRLFVGNERADNQGGSLAGSSFYVQGSV